MKPSNPLSTAQLARLADAWDEIQTIIPVHSIESEGDYADMLTVLDHLQKAADLTHSHALRGLSSIALDIVRLWESQQYPAVEKMAHCLLACLTHEHQVRPESLSHIVPADDIPLVLNGRLALTLEQIEQLCEYFELPDVVFEGQAEDTAGIPVQPGTATQAQTAPVRLAYLRAEGLSILKPDTAGSASPGDSTDAATTIPLSLLSILPPVGGCH